MASGLVGHGRIEILAGTGDLLTFGLAAQVRKPPSRQRRLVPCVLYPGGSIVGDWWGNTKCFFALVAKPKPPQTIPDIGK